MNCYRLIIPLAVIAVFSACGQENGNSNQSGTTASTDGDRYSYTLEHPVTPSWLLENIRPQHPRLILTPERLASARRAIRNEGLMNDYYTWILWNADQYLKEEPLVYAKQGRRMLSVSREALNRIACLSLAANLEAENQRYIERVNEEILALAAFPSWNPGHFLDVAEMALAVSIGIDWCHGMLPAETVEAGKRALVELALKPGASGEDYTFWLRMSNNWNQVCNGGLSAAAVTVAETEPELAARVIAQALESMPLALKVYWPDGIYPEGPGYWVYGTYFTALTSEIFTTGLGSDFGITDSPGFMKSALVTRMLVSPSGQYYNFSDCSTTMGPLTFWPLQAWFDGQKNGARLYNPDEMRKALREANEKKKRSRWLHPVPFLWMAEASDSGKGTDLPEFYVAGGENPVAVFRKNRDPRGFYFGAKGGRASLSHGNMDAGSFIYEIDGIRWFLDMGVQSYGPLEEIMGGGLWDSRQDSDRWTLLTKNNFGHSTLTVNGRLHRADAYASLKQTGDRSVEIDLTDVLGADVQKATRRISRSGDYTIRIEDRVVPNERTQTVVSGLITAAEVQVREGTVLLKQGSQTIRVSVLQPQRSRIRVVPLDPPPLNYDRMIEGLKRIEITLQAGKEAGQQPLEDVTTSAALQQRKPPEGGTPTATNRGSPHMWLHPPLECLVEIAPHESVQE